MADQPDTDETPAGDIQDPISARIAQTPLLPITTDDLVPVEIEVHPIDPGDVEIIEPPSADTIIG